MAKQLATSEIKQIAECLKRLEPGFLPYEIFVELARIMVLPVIEMVPLRLNAEAKIEVLLIPRAKDDDIWPGTVHTPGTVIRATDVVGSKYLPFERIIKDELGGTKISKPCYVGSVLHQSRRGVEHSQIFWVEVLGEPLVGQFYDVSTLPDNLVDSQPRFITEAARNFAKIKSHNL